MNMKWFAIKDNDDQYGLRITKKVEGEADINAVIKVGQYNSDANWLVDSETENLDYPEVIDMFDPTKAWSSKEVCQNFVELIAKKNGFTF